MKCRHGHPHPEDCPRCEALDAALGQVRSALAEHRADIEPDPNFSARVLARLHEEPAAVDALGWAALRLLPPAALLAGALVAWATFFAPSPSSLLGPEALLAGGASDDALVAFVLSAAGDDR